MEEKEPDDTDGGAAQGGTAPSFPSLAVPAPRPHPLAPSSQPLAPRRLHPAWILLSALRSARGLVLPLAVFLVSGRADEWWFLLVGGGLAAASLAAQALTWWLFRYEVSGGELRVRSGLIARRERSVPLERIQAVDTAESPLQRVFGLVQVKVETAAGGTGGGDVTLEALTRADAAALRARLTARRTPLAPAGVPSAAPTTPLPARDGGELIRALSPRELVAAGATSGQIGPALAVIFAALQVADDVVPDHYWERIAMTAPGLSLRGLATAALVLGVGAWGLAVAGTVLTFGGFELRRDGDRLLVSHGLLDRRRSTIPLARIQALTVTEGLLRQPFGLATVRVESAAYGKDTAVSGMLFPLLRRSEVPELLGRACPAFALALDGPAAPALTPLTARARRRYVLAPVWSLLATAAAATVVAVLRPRVPWWVGLLPLALAPPAAGFGWLRFRDTGWAVDGADRLVVRGRDLARQTVVVPRRRLQRRMVVRDPLQRRAHLATFRTAFPSGGSGGQVAVVHLDEATAFALLARLAPRPNADAAVPATAPTVGEATGTPREA